MCKNRVQSQTKIIFAPRNVKYNESSSQPSHTRSNDVIALSNDATEKE